MDGQSFQARKKQSCSELEAKKKWREGVTLARQIVPIKEKKRHNVFLGIKQSPFFLSPIHFENYEIFKGFALDRVRRRRRRSVSLSDFFLFVLPQ
jgi:hypothetical protein